MQTLPPGGLVLVDIGINLAHDSFDHDREAVIERALAAGVRRMIVTGSSLAATRDALRLCRRWPGLLRATAGVHPHHAVEFVPADADRLRELLDEPLVVAAGECGLDYYRNFSSPTEQRPAFEAQLAVAAAAGKPVFLHQRDAHRDFMAILGMFLPQLPKCVVHCFTGTRTELDDYLAAGCYIGVTGWVCDERRGLELRELVRHIPADRLMVETDAPYLLPRDLSPKPARRRNEPMYLAHINDVIAKLRGESPAGLARSTTANAMDFFGLPPIAADERAHAT